MRNKYTQTGKAGIGATAFFSAFSAWRAARSARRAPPLWSARTVALGDFLVLDARRQTVGRYSDQLLAMQRAGLI